MITTTDFSSRQTFQHKQCNTFSKLQWNKQQAHAQCEMCFESVTKKQMSSQCLLAVCCLSFYPINGAVSEHERCVHVYHNGAEGIQLVCQTESKSTLKIQPTPLFNQ